MGNNALFQGTKKKKNWARVHELLHLYLPSVVFISTCLIRHPYQNPHSMWVFAGETARVLLQHPKFKILTLNQIGSLTNFETHCVYIHSCASIKEVTAWPHWSHCCPSPPQIYFMVPSSSWCKSEKLKTLYFFVSWLFIFAVYQHPWMKV